MRSTRSSSVMNGLIRSSGMSDSVNTGLQARYLDAMGIQRWVARNAPVAAVTEAAVPAGTVPEDASSELQWRSLQAEVAACTRCELHATRTQTVFGTGDRRADWMIVGEAPGADEDRQGEPFVGRAGQLLNEMLYAAGFRRGQVYIANILKCRPPANRNPSPDEALCCQPFLERQIELVRPRLILALGGVAANNLLQSTEKVGALRGVSHHFGNRQVPLVVTYHPAYLLRSPLEKRKVWQDLQFALRLYHATTAA
jgi:uracil-DNA glycosylase family 4